MQASVVFVIQSEQDIGVSRKATPISTLDISEYIAVKFTSEVSPQQLREAEMTRQPIAILSSVSVWTCKNKAPSQGILINHYIGSSETKIAEVELTEEIELLDGESHNVKIEYSNSTLTIFLDSNTDPILEVAISISETIKLDNGSSYVGICQETFYTDNYLEIMNWSLVSSSTSFTNDKWSGLSLEYKTHWPLHLFISPDVHEKYNELFRFLFPLRRVQIDLQNCWKVLKKMVKVLLIYLACNVEFPFSSTSKK